MGTRNARAVVNCPIFLPSRHHPPTPLPGRPLPPDVTDNRVLWDLNAQGYNPEHRVPDPLASPVR